MLQRQMLAAVAACAVCAVLAGGAAAATIQWANPAGGSWSDPLNWSPNLVPGAGDDAQITLPGAYSVVISGGVSAVRSIVVGSGAGAETLTVAQPWRTTLVIADSIRVEPGALLRLSGPILSGAGQLINHGTLLVSEYGLIRILVENFGLMLPVGDPGAIFESPFRNRPGGVIRPGVYCSGPGGLSTVGFSACTNEGTFEMVTQNGCSCSASGAMVNVSTGLVDYTKAGHSALNFTLENHGLVDIGPHIVKLASIVNHGRIRMSASKTSSGIDNRPDGVIEGTGWIDHLSNSGLLRPGLPTGTLLLRSDYEQTATGTTELDVAGPSDFDRIDVQGVANNLGTLRLRSLGGYRPASGSTFGVMTSYQRAGAFDVLENAWVDGYPLFEPLVAGTSITLRSLGPGVTELAPSRGGDTGQVTTAFSGGHLESVAGVRLRRAGEADIVGALLALAPGGTGFSASFDLTGHAQGDWDVLVELGDASAIELPGAFSIEAGRVPSVSVQLVGPVKVMRNQPVRYQIVVTNSGNVDAEGAIRLLLPRCSAYEIQLATRPFAPVRVISGGALDEIDIELPPIVVRPGASFADLTVRLTAPAVGEDFIEAAWMP